jgi:hypothetical protein
VTIELPAYDIAPTASKGVDRRTLLKAGAWAAPVLVLTTASPAMAASVEPVPSAQLTVASGTLTNAGTSDATGPIVWAGGTIAWSRSTPGQPTIASVGYTVSLTGPGGLSTTLVTNSTNIPNGATFTVPGLSYPSPAAALTAGTYTITLTAIGTDGNKSAQTSVILVARTITGTGTPTREGQSNRYKLNATFTSDFSTPRTLTRDANLDALPTGVAFAAFPTSPITANANSATAFTTIATITGGATGQIVTFGYTYPTGSVPATAPVLVSITL